MSKHVAKSLKSVMENYWMTVITDRSFDPVPTAEQMIRNWSFDLFTRKPGPAIDEDGEFVGTDLDLATFMFTLAQRGAVINLPNYKRMRAATIREGERVISASNRHGKVVGMYANQDVFSFGVKIIDQNVVTQDQNTGVETTGAPRNFSLTGITGKWHPFWSPIEFSPSARENAFLQNNEIWTGNKVIFSQFVHPNRWVSLYGQHYFLAKAMIDRLEDEGKFLNTEIKRLLASGIEYPKTGNGAKYETPETKTDTTDTSDVMVDAFEVEIDIPEYKGEYKKLSDTQEALIKATSRRKHIVYNLKASLNFAVRTVELAFFLYGIEKTEDGKPLEKMPGWIQDAKWERDYKPKGKRNAWNRLILFQERVGESGVAIRYRVWKKKEKVTNEAKESL